MKDSDQPLWRTCLCWGAVILFLTLPVLILTARIVSASYPQFHIAESLAQAKFITAYFESLTALVFGLSGLNVFDKFSSNRKEKIGKDV